MPSPTHLLQRLDAIGHNLAQTPQALGLLGLGSVGRETARLDAHSDLDFFVIVAKGAKAAFLADLGWLTAGHPVLFHFQNTADGYKLLFADDVFCEFAVFEPDELTHIPYAPGRWVWRHPSLPEALAAPASTPASRRAPAWLLGEALTNLYVGLHRYWRGEKLTAQRFVQHYAVDRVVELVLQRETPATGLTDPFTPERRLEQRFPQLAAQLPAFVPGYDQTPTAARAILAFVAQHWAVPPALHERLVALCETPP